MCLGSFNGVQQTFKDDSRKFQESFRKVSRVCQGRLKGVSREILVGFKGI